MKPKKNASEGSPVFPVSGEQQYPRGEEEGILYARISRQDFIAIMTKLGIGTAAMVAAMDNEVMAEDEPKESDATQLDHERSGPQTHEAIHEKDIPEWLDWGTATAVLANFVRHVGYGSAIKGIDLGPRSALEMNLIAVGRVMLLKAFGGKEGGHLGKEELHEIKGGLIPLPILVFLSDLTTTELKVNPHEIFRKVEGMMNREMNYEDVKRPELSEGADVWREYLEKINSDIVTKTAHIAAVTTVLAPLGTTYTSSSLANTMKKDIFRMLYEQSYAMAVLEWREKMREHEMKFESKSPEEASGESIIDRNEIHEAASRRAELHFNGPRGFSKLMLTLGANIQGTWLLGDPPEIYFAINYHRSPETLLAAHSIGGIYSEISTLSLNLAWLAEVRAKPLSMPGKFLQSQIDTVQALGRTVVQEPSVRMAQRMKGEDIKTRVIGALEKNGLQGAEELRDVLRRIPASCFQLRWKDYISKKVASLHHLNARRDDFLRKVSQLNIWNDHFFHAKIYPHLFRLFQTQDTAGLEQAMGDIEGALQSAKADRIASLFAGYAERGVHTDEFYVAVESLRGGHPDWNDEDLIREAKERATENAASPDTPGSSEEALGSITRAQKIIEELFGDITCFDDGESRSARAMDAMAKEGNSERIRQILLQTDGNTVGEALRSLTSLEGLSDPIPGLGEEASERQGSRGRDSHGHHVLTGDAEKKSELMRKMEVLQGSLSHSAREVLWALLTQIPSVPGIARFAKLVLPIAAGVKNGDRPTGDQLKKIISVMIFLEAGISATADNVAAYLFAENVLFSFFTGKYGDSVFLEHPQLKMKIGIIAKMIAEAAGNLTKLGNGPNFSQEKFVILESQDNAQGIDIDVQKLHMSESLPHENHFAAGWDFLTCLLAIQILHGEVDALEASDKNKGKADIPEVQRETRRGFLTKYFMG